MLQRQQIFGGDLAAADRQHMAQALSLVPAASAVPPHDQPLDDEEQRGQQVEQCQYHTGKIGDPHLVQYRLEHHHAHQVDHRNDAAFAPQAVQAGVVIQTQKPQHPGVQHGKDHAGDQRAGVLGNVQRGTCAALLEKPDIAEPADRLASR